MQTDLFKVIQESGTPLYVYDEKGIRENFRKLAAFPYEPTEVYFASMCNNNPEIIKLAVEEGLKVFVNSMSHLSLCFSQGLAPEDIGFTSTNLSDEDLVKLDQASVFTNLDSLGQLERFGKLLPGRRVGLRINPDVNASPESHAGVFIGPRSRIGVMENDVNKIKKVLSDYGLSLVSLHVYVGTNIFNTDIFVEVIERLVELARHFPEVDTVNIGGGLGVPERRDEPAFDLEAYKKKVSLTMKQGSAKLGRRLKLVIEPGRYAMASNGVFLARVTDVKTTSSRRFIGTDASVAIFPRPLFYPDTCHPVRILGKEKEENIKIPTYISGKTTYSRDILASDIRLPEAEPGDILEIGNAGAYCYSCITDFLGFDRPAEVLLTKDGPRVIRQRSMNPTVLNEIKSL